MNATLKYIRRFTLHSIIFIYNGMIVVQYVLVQMFYHVDVLLFGFFIDSFNVDDFINLGLKVVDFLIKDFFSCIDCHAWWLASFDYFEQLDWLLEQWLC